MRSCFGPDNFCAKPFTFYYSNVCLCFCSEQTSLNVKIHSRFLIDFARPYFTVLSSVSSVLFSFFLFLLLLVFLFYLSSVITRPSRQFPLASRAFVRFVQLIIITETAAKSCIAHVRPEPFVADENVTETKKHAKNIKIWFVSITCIAALLVDVWHAKQKAVCSMTR